MPQHTTLSCVWVPGTTDTVRVNGAGIFIERKLSSLKVTFGAHSLDDLYLKGRVSLRANPAQLAQLS